MTSERVSATAAALELIGQLVARHGALMFHQSGGCCDGSAPMCLARGELQIGAQDVHLGQIGGQPFYIGSAEACAPTMVAGSSGSPCLICATRCRARCMNCG